jgi:hypothetical protein
MSNGKIPYIALYTGDWIKDPKLAKCSLATRGAWLEFLCAMHTEGTGHVQGTPEELARIARCEPEEMTLVVEELRRTGAAEVRKIGTNGGRGGLDKKESSRLDKTTYRITCRRMTRECNAREQNRKRVQKHRLAGESRECNGDETILKRECNNALSYSYSCSVTDPSLSSSDEEERKDPSTHTHSSSARGRPPKAADAAVCVRGSFFSLEDCRKYAESLREIRNPVGFAKTIYRSGSDDQAIEEFLRRGARHESDEERYARIFAEH